MSVPTPSPISLSPVPSEGTLLHVARGGSYLTYAFFPSPSTSFHPAPPQAQLPPASTVGRFLPASTTTPCSRPNAFCAAGCIDLRAPGRLSGIVIESPLGQHVDCSCIKACELVAQQHAPLAQLHAPGGCRRVGPSPRVVFRRLSNSLACARRLTSVQWFGVTRVARRGRIRASSRVTTHARPAPAVGPEPSGASP